MIVEQSRQIIAEVNKAFIGKNEIVEKVLMTIYAGGHILLEDCPGVGKNDTGCRLFQSAWTFPQTNPVHHRHASVRHHRF